VRKQSLKVCTGAQSPLKSQLPKFGMIATPSPVRRLDGVGRGGDLWVKDDSRLHPLYGGNKCRKLMHLLKEAEKRDKCRLITFGAAGSHHVLATGLLAAARGFKVSAFVVAQPWSKHAEQVLCASAACGVDLIPARSMGDAFVAVRRLFTPRCAFIPPGGSNVCGSLGYFEAALELAQQVQLGALPEPDCIVVAFGTAGTVAGLWAGIELTGLKSRIVGVSVLRAKGRALYARRIAQSILRAVDSRIAVRPDRLVIDCRWIGAGYGYESEAGRTATLKANLIDLPLDPTYTAKAFAGALSLVKGMTIGGHGEAGQPNWPVPPDHVLYWHTLSASSPIQESTSITTLPPNIRALLRPCRQS